MDKIKKLQAAVSSGDPPQSPASTAPSAQVAVPGIANCAHAICMHMCYYMYICLDVYRGAMYTATGRGSHAAGAPAVSAASEAAMSSSICKELCMHCQNTLEVTCMQYIIYELPCKFMHACMITSMHTHAEIMHAFCHPCMHV